MLLPPFLEAREAFELELSADNFSDLIGGLAEPEAGEDRLVASLTRRSPLDWG